MVKIFERLIGQSIYGNVEMLCEVVSFITVSVIQFTAGSVYRGVCQQGGLPTGGPASGGSAYRGLYAVGIEQTPCLPHGGWPDPPT